MIRRAPHTLFAAFLLAVVFSVQFSLPIVDSQFASLNLSDFVVLAIAGVFVTERVTTDDWIVSLSLPRQTAWFLVVGGWILVSLAVALVRSPFSVLPNALWALKWFEILGALVLAQAFDDRVNWDAVVTLLAGSGTLVAVTTVARTVTTSGYTQATVSWHNPNTLAVFLVLPALLCLVQSTITIGERPISASIGLCAGLCCLLGVVTIGSRSGLITLLVGATVATMLSYRRGLTSWLVGGVVTGILTAGGILLATRPLLLRRFLPTVRLVNGMFVFSGPGTGAIYTRYELTRTAIELWIRRPVFGYGWFASPENPSVGFLDVFYTQVLVDVGIVGFVLVGGFYLVLVRGFVSRRADGSVVVPTAGAGWLVGMLVAGIGGAHARVPRLMFLLVIVLVAADRLRTRPDRERYWS